MVINTSATSSLFLPILVLAIATLVGTSSAWSLWPYKHVHVSNKLTTSNDVLHVHCWAKHKDTGYQDVGVGAEYTWRFKPNFFGTAKWTCDVWTDDNRHASFYSYWEDADQRKREHKENIYWVVHEDGVYLKFVQENRDQYWAKWQTQ